MIGDGLAYVSVVVRDVEAVASILERDFQLLRTNCTVGSSGKRAPVFSVGGTGLALFETGDEFVGGAERTGVRATPGRRSSPPPWATGRCACRWRCSSPTC